MNSIWQSGIAYEQFMGRWSTPVAQHFLRWLEVPPARHWLDVGCGTGSLTKLILAHHQPKEVTAIDASVEFIAHAQQSINDPTVHFQVGLAQALELDAATIDAVVSGLVLNFVPEPSAAIAEMLKATKPDGIIGVFVWDYADGMKMLRHFWDTAAELDANAKALDEGVRFPLCQAGQLESLMADAGLKQIEASAIEVPTIFQNFEDYWEPFLGGVGPAPSYVMSLSQTHRNKLEETLRNRISRDADGSIAMTARAWAVKGRA